MFKCLYLSSSSTKFLRVLCILLILSIDSFLDLNCNIELVHSRLGMFYYVLRVLGSNDSVIFLPLIKLFVLEFG